MSLAFAFSQLIKSAKYGQLSAVFFAIGSRFWLSLSLTKNTDSCCYSIADRNRNWRPVVELAQQASTSGHRLLHPSRLHLERVYVNGSGSSQESSPTRQSSQPTPIRANGAFGTKRHSRITHNFFYIFTFSPRCPQLNPLPRDTRV